MNTIFSDLKLSNKEKEQIIAKAGGRKIRIPDSLLYISLDKQDKRFKNFFDINLSDSIKKQLIKEAGGMRFRIPNYSSKSDIIYIEKKAKLICLAYKEKMSSQEISKFFNLSKRTIQRILKDNGLAGKSYNSEENALRLEKMKMMLESGKSKRKIAKELGISRERVYQIKRKEGLK